MLTENRMKKRQVVASNGSEEDVYIATSSTIVGDVKLAKGVNVWYGAVIRGDEAEIAIGEETNVQDNAVLHCDPGVPMAVGRQVTIGHGAILHGSSVGDRVIVGMGSILLSGSKIGDDSLVAAGAVVTPNKEFPPRSLIMGSPAKVVKELSAQQLSALIESAAHYVRHAIESAE